MYQLKEPTQKISLDAIKVWRISDLINTTIALIIFVFLVYLDRLYNWDSWIEITLYALIGFTCISAIIELIILPVYKQKTWRYEIDDRCIQLKYGGVFKKTHIIIPIDKIYFVDTYQGPIIKKYNLVTIKIGTIGLVHDIPNLPFERGIEIRNNIALIAENYKRQSEEYGT
ncbi:PH domain-containing protein [Exiguobacterium sp. s191]|uniref:PH domain-containing protein n=1 Tax=Exiguobacterium sp. s191 TaxID=2751196 RepID=UPI001BE693E5|nr:PH domain-containing protein [Exiguobacterium sp. s191]